MAQRAAYAILSSLPNYLTNTSFFFDKHLVELIIIHRSRQCRAVVINIAGRSVLRPSDPEPRLNPRPALHLSTTTGRPPLGPTGGAP